MVVTATLPRFLLNGDRARCISISTMSKAAPATMPSPAARKARCGCGEARDAEGRARGQATQPLSVPLTAASAGPTTVTVRVAGPGGFALERSYPLNVKPATQVVARRTVRPIAKGESLTLSGDLFADLVPAPATSRSRSGRRPRSMRRRS